MTDARSRSALSAPKVVIPCQRPIPEDSKARAAFPEYYQRDFLGLTRFLMRLGAKPHEAADAAQSAFVLAFEQWDSIRNPGAWLRTVAKRRSDALCSGSVREQLADQLPDLPGGRCPVAAVELGEEEARVYEALSWLPARQREVMAWTLDGYRPQEIAQIMEITPEAPRKNLERGRALLKQALLRPADGGGQ
ncbi:RNA polymerase sigma factor [Streptomyces lonegramiae]|uniref:Sigma-70 family RNA polymerase sigma factor n=1 Tax=Streptomyces lonegramiae TaxID=3075524 RepID=A0ABU2XP99_9ACTN|nr:sigma-70 family RNA polymerase sigma factor [Streptomyces sp. DSM 41529]MDT0547758.1 sigma-70 family RNA polymerase sigma factor [Streptomyces sp. DSM 41529]